MKKLLVLSVLAIALIFTACDNKKAEEERQKAIQDSIALVQYNDSVANVALQQHIADSLKAIEDSLILQAYNDSVAAAAKKPVRKTTTTKTIEKPATIQDIKTDQKSVTPAGGTDSRRGG